MRNTMKAMSTVGLLALGCALAGPASAVDLTLTNSAVGFSTPIGIDFHEPTSKLILSVNYTTGSGLMPTPGNLALVDPVTGTASQFSTLAGLTNELKVATVRASACQGGFAVGEVFTGNGNAGQIVRIGPTGSPVLNPWVSLGTTDLVRGSFFQDRFCAAGGDLIVVTANEQTDPPVNTSAGNVYRITSGGAATLVGTTGTHLEGVTTVPNLPLVYGPLAGRILAGAEDLISNADGTAVSYGPNGRIYAFDPTALNSFFTIGAGSGPPCSAAGLPNGCNFATSTIHPEDLDVIRRNSVFFGINYNDFPAGRMLTAPAANFAGRCGQVLVTREFPAQGTSGLSALHWDAGTSSVVVDALSSNLDGTADAVQQWEHVTFTSGNDCATTHTIVKTPDNGTFTVGQQITWTLVVTNTGPVPDLAVKITDPLPTTGGLTWGTTTTTAGSCSVVSNQLSCSLGDIAPLGSVTVTVTTNNVGGAPAAACTGSNINNTGTATSDNAADATDDGSTKCTLPPQLRVVKTPDNGTFVSGAQVSFTIVVSNPAGAGAQSATNVTLSDQLPGNGGLVWVSGNTTTTQGTCSISASNLLTCSLGTIAAGGSVTITVSSGATTPAAACQSQPNPIAKATADGPLSAQDEGSLTCTPPPPGGLIAPTQTTCQNFTSGTASALGQIIYSVSGGKIGQNINPGVFFYYTTITTTVANQVVTVSQSHTGTAAAFEVQKDQAKLYTANCSSSTNGTLIASNTGATFTVATPGTYIISVKYSTKSIAGTSAPVPNDITYTFTTNLGASTSATVLLKKM